MIRRRLRLSADSSLTAATFQLGYYVLCGTDGNTLGERQPAARRTVRLEERSCGVWPWWVILRVVRAPAIKLFSPAQAGRLLIRLAFGEGSNVRCPANRDTQTSRRADQRRKGLAQVSLSPGLGRPMFGAFWQAGAGNKIQEFSAIPGPMRQILAPSRLQVEQVTAR